MTKEIELDKGSIALVDDSDYEWLNQWKWHAQKDRNTHYAARGQRHYLGKAKKTIFMHELLLDCPKGMLRDHKDNNGLNNQRKNLRVVTPSQNACNSTIRRWGKTSRFKGVYFHKNSSRWMARLGYQGKIYFIGNFYDEIQAALAYDKKAQEIFGDYARLNQEIYPELFRMPRTDK
jgi:hypothetical protein